MWDTILKRTKAAGINLVQTYVFWYAKNFSIISIDWLHFSIEILVINVSWIRIFKCFLLVLSFLPANWPSLFFLRDLHNPEPGVFYFDNNADLNTFLSLCQVCSIHLSNFDWLPLISFQANGLYVNLRIGPYICAEWNFGALPAWLKFESGIVFRDYNMQFMAAMSTWMEYLVDYVRPFFANQGGPVSSQTWHMHTTFTLG